MNKIFKKVAVLSVGLTMAIGAGVVLGTSAKTERADAVVTTVKSFDFEDSSAHRTSGNNSYSTNSYSQGGVDISLTYADSVTTGTPISGTANVMARVAKNTTNSPLVVLGPMDLSGYTVTGFSYYAKTVGTLTLTASYSTDGSTWTTGETHAGGTSATQYESGELAIDSPESFYLKIAITVTNGTSTGSNRDTQIDDIAILGESNSGATLSSISLDNDGAKTAYVDGDSVSFTGIKAIGHFSDDSTQDLSSSCTITADKSTVTVGDSSITYSATYNGEGDFEIADLHLAISVSALEVESVTAQSGFRTSFVEKQKLSFGTGKLKVTYNNGTEPTISPTSSGVSMRIGTLDITGSTHYMTLDDNGKDLIASVGGVDCTIGTLTVTPYDEPENGYWSQVTDYSDLSEDDQVIIVASSHEFAMGKYSTGNNVMAIDITKDGEGKISSSIPGVQVYTLKEGTQNNTFGLFDGENYLMAASASQNQLKVESEISDNSSFSVSESGIVAQGTNTRNVIRYNSNDIIFSCYASTSTVGSLACLYKFTPEAKSEDQLAVEEFCKTALHLDDTAVDYIDPNDNTAGSACLGPTGLYEAAKAAYASQINNAERKTIFATSADTLIKWGRDRLTAWALANKEVFDANEGTFTPEEEASSFSTVTSADNSLVILITIISGVSLVAISSLLVLKKKRK